MTFAVRPNFQNAQNDPNWALRSLGLHFDGVEGSTTFVDNSPTPKSPTVSGNAKITVSQKVFGGSLALDGAGDYLTYSGGAAFDFGAGDFTLSCWYRPVAANVDYEIFAYGAPTIASSAPNWAFGLAHFGASVAGKVRGFFYASSTQYAADSIGALVAGAWVHIELSRASGTMRLFLGGVLQATTAAAASPNTPASRTLRIGAMDSTGRFANGNIDEVLIYKGIALHTANFTPPQRPFADR